MALKTCGWLFFYFLPKGEKIGGNNNKICPKIGVCTVLLFTHTEAPSNVLLMQVHLRYSKPSILFSIVKISNSDVILHYYPI